MILLASASPQRSALLREAGWAFSVVQCPHNEDSITDPKPARLALERAKHKAGAALAALEQHPGAVLLAADTVVALGNTELGKPADAADAERILGLLSGSTHQVITGHCCMFRDTIGTLRGALAVAISQVRMRRISTDQIKAYVATGECFGKAGAYAIQAGADSWVEEVQGDRDTVIGLHVASVARLHRELTGQPPAAAAAG